MHYQTDYHRIFAMIIAFLATTSLDNGIEGRKVCHTFLTCAPLILSVPLREIVDASKYYSKSFLVASEITDEEWENQMKLVEHLCHTWISFDTCMERNWMECVDWQQLMALLDVMAGRVEQVGVRGAKIDHAAANHAKGVFDRAGWNERQLRDAMDIATYTCRNVRRITPIMKCGRDTIMGNETILNTTLRFRALAEAKCFDGAKLACGKVEAMMKLLGHWFYHGCRKATEELTEMVRTMFMTVFGYQFYECRHILRNQTAKELFEAPPPPEVYRNFGEENIENRCNMTEAEIHYQKFYYGTVSHYVRSHNMTKKMFFEMMQERRDGIRSNTASTASVQITASIQPKLAAENVQLPSVESDENSSEEESTTTRATARYGKRRRRPTTTRSPSDDYGTESEYHSSAETTAATLLYGILSAIATWRIL